MAKILISGSWPSGWVSYLVIFCSGFGILIVLLIWPLIDSKENNWIKWYSRITFFSILPLSGMLGISIYKRIAEYGLTEERSILVLLTIWLFSISIYFVASKLRSIKIIPVSLCIFLFLGNIGPWGIGSLSKKAQFNELQTILTKNKLVANNEWQRTSKIIPRADLYEIGNKTEYLIRHFGHAALQPLVSRILIDSVGKSGKWNITPNLMDKLGLTYVSYLELKVKKALNNKYISIEFPEYGETTGYKVEDESYFIPFQVYDFFHTEDEINLHFKGQKIEDEKKRHSLKLANNSLIISVKGNISTIGLEDFADSLFSKYQNDPSNYSQSETSCKSFYYKSASGSGELLITKIEFESNQKILKIKGLNGILILKNEAELLSK